MTDNFNLSGKPVVQLDPSTCTGMSCNAMTPTSFSQGSSATATATVPPTTSGSSPIGTFYVGYAWPDGTNRNECGFTISSGTVNTDGTSTQPTGYGFIYKYTKAGTRLQPGCKFYGVSPNSQCSVAGGDCVYTGTFSIETYNN